MQQLAMRKVRQKEERMAAEKARPLVASLAAATAVQKAQTWAELLAAARAIVVIVLFQYYQSKCMRDKN